MLLLRSHASRQAPTREREEEPDPAPASAPPSWTEGDEVPRELMAAWVQFLKGDIAEAVNVLHNRLNVIAANSTIEGPNLTGEQRGKLEQIRVEIGAASQITSGLLHRVSSAAPDTIPQVVHEYDGSDLGPASVLIVEDDDANRVVIMKLLVRLGLNVTGVTNGLQAYDVLKDGEIDCIISDLRLPFVGGRTLFEQVEQNMPHLASRFVFVTGDYTNPESREFLDQTGQPVVGKPYEVEALLGAVAMILRKGPGEGVE